MKLTTLLIATLLIVQAFAQLENRLQPDSIYKNRKVRTIYAYQNSKKDLSEVIELNKEGYKVRSSKYSASYDAKSRQRKKIELITFYKYNSQMMLIQIIDSVIYWDGSCRLDKEYFYYNKNGVLDSSKKFKGNLQIPTSETYYYEGVNNSTTIRRNDTSITYHKTKEYYKGFYVTKFYGYYLEPILKTRFTTQNGDTTTFQYSDYSELKRYEDTMTIRNTFNPQSLLTKSAIRSLYMNDRVLEYQLTYKYYPNGLLKSIRGYVPEFFKYDFY